MKKLAKILLMMPILAAGENVSSTPNLKVMCQIQRKATLGELSEPSAFLKTRTLSSEQEGQLSNQRACIKSYAHQFPGGLDEMLKASSLDLKKNLQQLRTEFGNSAYSRNVSGDRADRVRAAYIKGGWDPKQVILFGSVLMIRSAYREGDFDVVLSESAKVRKEFSLKAEKLEFWDEMQEHTYFSPEALGNMIISIEYLAKVRKPGISREVMQNTITDYMRNRDALMPFAKFVGNPDAFMFQGICGKSH